MKTQSLRADVGLLHKKLEKSISNIKEKAILGQEKIDLNKILNLEKHFSPQINSKMGEIAKIRELSPESDSLELLKREEEQMKKHELIMKAAKANGELKMAKKETKINRKPQVLKEENKAKIKHLNPRLSKENQKHMSDFMDVKLSVIQELGQSNNPEQSKVIDLEVDNSSSVPAKKDLLIKKSGFDAAQRNDVEVENLSEDRFRNYGQKNEDLREEANNELEDSLEVPARSSDRNEESEGREKEYESSFNMKTLDLISFTPVITNKAKLENSNVRSSLQTQYLGDSLDNMRLTQEEIRRNNEKTVFDSYEGKRSALESENPQYRRQVSERLAKNYAGDGTLAGLMEGPNKSKRQTPEVPSAKSEAATAATSNPKSEGTARDEDSLGIVTMKSQNSEQFDHLEDDNISYVEQYAQQQMISGSFRPKSALMNKQLFPEVNDFYIPKASRPISASHLMTRGPVKLDTSYVSNAGRASLAGSQIDPKKSLLASNGVLPNNSALQRAGSRILDNQSVYSHSVVQDSLDNFKQAMQDTKAINFPTYTFEMAKKDFYSHQLPEVNALSKNPSILSKADSITFDNESFLRDSLQGSRVNFDDLAYSETLSKPKQSLADVDLVQALNSVRNQRKSYSNSPVKAQDYSILSQQSAISKREKLSPSQNEIEDSLNLFVQKQTKASSLSGITYDAQKPTFQLDNLDTLRSHYTLQTQKSQVIRDSLTDDSLNIRDVGSETQTDRTLESVYTNSRQVTHSVDAYSYHANNSLSRSIQADEYRGPLKKLSFLGGGAEAKVYLVKFPDSEELVALKQYELTKAGSKHEESYDALRKEFKMLKKLSHKNIIQYFCLHKPKKTSYSNCIEYGIVMEYMRGGCLEKHIEQNFEKMSMQEKKLFIHQILAGLEFLHRNNIMHRDLKPANLLLSGDRKELKLSDFGISKQIEDANSIPQTMVGTPWYMAPEVINSEPYSLKADIWSAGCCFYHLLTGKKPYHQAKAIQALMIMSYQNPLEACDQTTKKDLESTPYLWEFMSLCFSREKALRPSANELLKHPFLKDVSAPREMSLLSEAISSPKDPKLLSDRVLNTTVLSTKQK